MTDNAWKAHRPAIDQWHAPAAAKHAEHRDFLDDPQIAPKRKFQAACDRISRDGCDDRFRKKHPRRPHRRRRAVGANPVAPIASTREGFEVRACAEYAMIAEKDANTGFVIGFESLKCRDKLGRRRGINRIPGVRAVQNHRRYRPLLFRSDSHGRTRYRSKFC
jgi:hypothetical protein